MPAAGFEASLGGGGDNSPFSADSYEDEAQPATAAPAGFAAAPVAGGDEDGPPLDELEAQMRGEIAARDSSATASPAARRAAVAAAEDEDGDGKSAAALPELDALVARLPAEVRETLDELFRARFIAVKKLPKKLLQPASSKRGGASTDAAQ